MFSEPRRNYMNRITSIGEILFDIYPMGKALGGASFNFIYHIIKLLGYGNFISRIGNDNEGDEIIEFLGKNNIPAEYLQIDHRHPTGRSIANLNEMKIPSWEIKTETAYDYIELEEKIESLINDNTDCLYFGSLVQRNSTSRKTIQHFFRRDIKYFCDLNIRQNFYTKELIVECLTACNALKLNADELRLVNELLLNQSSDLNDAPLNLMDRYHIDQLCVTYGDQGAAIYKGGNINHNKLKIDNVVDTVGAGDAYAAVFCIGYLNNWDIKKTNRIASEFAGEIVKIKGALPADSSLYEKYKQAINA
jgi:fructokinase